MIPARRHFVWAMVLLVSACHHSNPAIQPNPQATPPRSGPPSGATPAGAPGGPSPVARPAGFPQGAPQDSAARPQPQLPPGQAGEPSPRPYNRVITPEAKSKEGLFKTHRIGSRLLFEIPRRELGHDMLVVPRAARVPVNAGYGGQQSGATQVFRWERKDNRVLLRRVSFETVADSTTPIYQAVRNSNFDIIVAAFNVEAYGPDSSMVIDVSRLYTAPPPELGVGAQFRGTPDPARSFVERVLTFPQNIEVEAALTYPPAPQLGAGLPFNPFGPATGGTQSVLMHWSMVRLPDQPMMARRADKRIGYFSIQQLDYGRPDQRAENREYIVRWRLEKRDPAAALSEPVKPITYYVDPATPDWLKPWIRRAIEDWQPAFEAAGFRHGIVAKDAPSSREDPDWSPEDVRYSVIRWFPSTTENAQGPNVHDPRSGEILDADIYVYHNVMNLQRAWYFSQVGHLDPRARMWPFPDSLMGRLVEFVVAHEIGHTLGYQHDQKGSSTYPVDSVRSRSWVHRMGHSPSIMDYSRFNYTAQPEDRIDLPDLIPGIGPWDKYTTHWGYAPIPGARSPDDEWATLDGWSRQQDSVPWYRFNLSDSRGADPGDQSEAVGDGDAVKATGWGLKSLKQVVPLIAPATVRNGESYDDLEWLYGRVIGQWTTELRHVADVVGGADAQEKYAGQAGVRYRPLPRARQKDAVRFLNENAFATPGFFLLDDILRRIEVEGSVRRINQAQSGILATLFNDRRMERLIEYEALAPGQRDIYSLAEMLADVRGGLWSELGAKSVTIDPYRRELQRSYLSQARAKITPPPLTLPAGIPAQFLQLIGPARATSDIRALFRSELVALDAAIRAALPKAANRETRAHLEDARDQIDKTLHPERS